MAVSVLVIGGGAAGLMAGISAARAGAKVTILEAGERVGKKLLATGNGKCNYTNLDMKDTCFHSEQFVFPGQVLERFNEKQTLGFFESLGVLPRIKGSYVYPRSEQAACVLDGLRLEAEECGVEIQCGDKAVEIRKKKYFQVTTAGGTYPADRVIVSTGGKAAPKTGSDGSGYELAKAMGHTIIPVIPALVQLKAAGSFFKSIHGVRTQAKVQIWEGDHFLAEDTGELQLTDYGISGIPVFQVSRYAAKALRDKKKVCAVLDFIPEMSKEELLVYLMERCKQHAGRSNELLLAGVLPKKLAIVCLKEAEIPLKKTWGELTRKQWDDIVRTLKKFTVTIIDTNGFANAQTCGGGIDTREIIPATCESRIVQGLYFAGEIMDVDGICGGYNLQWAWSSGYLAGQAAAKE